jgi:hypothetical protein
MCLYSPNLSCCVDFRMMPLQNPTYLPLVLIFDSVLSRLIRRRSSYKFGTRQVKNVSVPLHRPIIAVRMVSLWFTMSRMLNPSIMSMIG